MGDLMTKNYIGCRKYTHPWNRDTNNKKSGRAEVTRTTVFNEWLVKGLFVISQLPMDGNRFEQIGNQNV